VKRSLQPSAFSTQACLGAALALVLLGGASGRAEPEAGPEADRLRSAKALFFDRKYAEAREAWRQVLAGARGAQADTAAYWIARSSESLGEDERAFREYGDYLARRPADRAAAEQARTSRVGLAARLVKKGQAAYRSTLTEALDDPSRSVRIFTAIQLAGLDARGCAQAASVLQAVVTGESDEDLVYRARLALMRCERQPDGPPPPDRSPASASTRWLKIRVFEKALARPRISINIPIGLADLVYKSLPEDTREDLRRKGYDADNFWERIRRMPPAQILEIEGDEGERIQIWIE
jgi:hypothetical protein